VEREYSENIEHHRTWENETISRGLHTSASGTVGAQRTLTMCQAPDKKVKFCFGEVDLSKSIEAHTNDARYLDPYRSRISGKQGAQENVCYQSEEPTHPH
jgi:hypothetical protein